MLFYISCEEGYTQYVHTCNSGQNRILLHRKAKLERTHHDLKPPSFEQTRVGNVNVDEWAVFP